MEQKNILAKMHAIMSEANYIQKDAKNKFHGYSYATERVIKEKLHELLVKHKVIFKLETGKPQVIKVQPNKEGEPQGMTILDCVYAFYDIESGESFGGVFASSGPARDDKGLWAATTNAIKYILTSSFLIPTGDDCESDQNHPANNNNSPPANNPAPNPPEISNMQKFQEFWRARCKKLNNLLTPKTQNGWDHIVDKMVEKCSQYFNEITTNFDYKSPLPGMPKDDTGWLVLREVAHRIEAEVVVGVTEEVVEAIKAQKDSKPQQGGRSK